MYLNIYTTFILGLYKRQCQLKQPHQMTHQTLLCFNDLMIRLIVSRLWINHESHGPSALLCFSSDESLVTRGYSSVGC